MPLPRRRVASPASGGTRTGSAISGPAGAASSSCPHPTWTRSRSTSRPRPSSPTVRRAPRRSWSPTRRGRSPRARHPGQPRRSAAGEVLTVVDEIEHDRRDLRSRLVAVRVDGTGEREVLGRDAGLSISEVAIADDGAIAVLAYDAGESGIDFVAPGVALWLLEEDGPRRLTDADTIDLGEVGSHITADRRRLPRAGSHAGPGAPAPGDACRCGHGGARRRRRGRRPRRRGGSGRRIGRHPGLARRARRRSSTAGPARSPISADDAEIAAPRELTIEGRDGYPVHGWVAQPAGDGPFPVILQIHGGPYATYGIHLFDETQVLVDAGYAVVYCNPRGSAGYGTRPRPQHPRRDGNRRTSRT